MLDFLKKLIANYRLKKWLVKNPSKNINIKTGQVLLEELRVTVFVNKGFPRDYQLHGVADSCAQWFYHWGSLARSKGYENAQRAGNPTIYVTYDTDEMKKLIEDASLENKAISYFAGEPLAICIGPMFEAERMGFNAYYEQLPYY